VNLILTHRPEGLAICRTCSLLELSRSSFYALVNAPPRVHSHDEAVEKVCARYTTYGYRRVTAQLRHEGSVAGVKAVRLAMRRLGLLGQRKRRQKRTTVPVPVDAENLLISEPASGPRRVFAADATWIPLGKGRGLYLAVVLDLFTRQALGCALGTRLDTELTLNALSKALGKGFPSPDWIHHSDRGSTYASEGYRRCILSASGRSSFTKPGKPQQNGAVESFFKTLKHEEFGRNEYETPAAMIEALENFIRYYNQERLHSSLGYIAPDQFAEKLCSKG
jgi:putative transposase